jgi:integrase
MATQRKGHSLYKRGPFRLAWDRKRDGSLRSPYLTIFWYDEGAKRVRSISTGTADRALAEDRLDKLYLERSGREHRFCSTCGQRTSGHHAYLLSDAFSDYLLEHGHAVDSAASVKARLKHVLHYLEESEQTAVLCSEIGDLLVQRFRAWSALQPVQWRNKEGVVTVEKDRAPATTEESVHQLKTALNHAFRNQRVERPPNFRTYTRKQVSATRVTRVEIEVMRDMLLYAAESTRRATLHKFIIATIATLARPSAVFDISVASHRKQWIEGSNVVNLNPAGRVQTTKHRPIVPVRPVLRRLLEEARRNHRCNGWLIDKGGEPIQSVETAWTKMLTALKLPKEREFMPYLLRHSMATILRNWNGSKADPWQLAGQMGHRLLDTTELYAVHDPAYLGSVQVCLQEVIDQICERAPTAFDLNTGHSPEQPRGSK